MRINHNLNAMNAHRNMAGNTNKAGRAMEKLSSGLRINRAGDDAAGLAISEKMRGQIRGLDQAGRNANDGISMIQTAEGALNESQSILQRMRELAVQGSNDTLTTGDRDKIQSEIDQLNKEIDRIGNNTEFNTKNLLDGTLSGATTKQVHQSKNTTGLAGGVGNATTLSTLTDASGNSIALAAGDVVTINWTNGGTVYTASVTVALTNTMATILTNLATTGGIQGASVAGGVISFSSTASAASGAIGAFTITAKSASGDEKTAFNNAVNQFTTTKKAQDTTSDTSATIHIGANAGQSMDVDINKIDKTSLGTDAIDVTTQASANVSITAIEEALTAVSEERAKIGAFQNRLEHTIANLETSSENLTASESRIRDVDMAKEMMNYSKTDILNQAAQAMLAKANQQPQGVLQLLR